MLLDHQKRSIEHLNSWKVGALFMEAGTGKTRAAGELIKRVHFDFLLYITKLRTIDNVKAELTKWNYDISKFYFVGVESISMSDRIYLQVRDMILSASKPFIVVDESLTIKNIEAKRTQRVLELGSHAEYKLVLNGTPLSKNLLDLYSQITFLSPKILNMTFQQYKNTFCCYTTVTKIIGNWKKQNEYITGYENIDYLYSLLRHYIFEADLNLNITQNYNTIKYRIDDEAKGEYNYIKEHYLDNDILEMKNNNIFLEMTQKMQHIYCCTDDKFEAVDNLFKEIPQSKTIIFCKFVNSRVECEKRYPDAKVLSYQKESFGLNLQDYHHTIYFDKTWDLATRTQASRRTYRTGQDFNCTYYDLTGNVGLEMLIDANIEKKVSMTEYFKGKTKQQLKEIL